MLLPDGGGGYGGGTAGTDGLGGGGGAGMGGAVFNEAGTVVITNSTFTGNTASGGAGGTGSSDNLERPARGWAADCSTTTAPSRSPTAPSPATRRPRAAAASSISATHAAAPRR